MTERKLDVLCYRELDWLIICLPYPSRFQNIYMIWREERYNYVLKCKVWIEFIIYFEQSSCVLFPDFYVFDGWMIYSKIIGLNTKKHFKLWILIWKQSFLVPWCEFYDLKLCGNLWRSFYSNLSIVQSGAV